MFQAPMLSALGYTAINTQNVHSAQEYGGDPPQELELPCQFQESAMETSSCWGRDVTVGSVGSQVMLGSVNYQLCEPCVYSCSYLFSYL